MIEQDTMRLMRELAAMAGMDAAPIRRMVLVLDMDDLPRLYTEGYLDGDKVAPLTPTTLETRADTPITVSTEGGLGLGVEVQDTTTQQNERWRTKVPKVQPPPPAPVAGRACDLVIVDDPTVEREAVGISPLWAQYHDRVVRAHAARVERIILGSDIAGREPARELLADTPSVVVNLPGPTRQARLLICDEPAPTQYDPDVGHKMVRRVD